jgi:hypothetical protein
MFVDPPPGSSDQYITRVYEWEFEERQGFSITTHRFKVTLNIPKELYEYYSERERAPSPDYSLYVTHPEDDSFLEVLAGNLTSTAEAKGFDDLETLSFIAAFAQDEDSICYALEGAEGEYPKYPLETLVDQDGDCEDTCILLAALLQIMGYDVVLVNFPPGDDESAGHMGLGVAGDFSGVYYAYGGTNYYYLETTDKWELGEIDDDYRDRQATLYTLDPAAILTLSHDPDSPLRWLYPTSDTTLWVTVQNWGSEAAEDAYVYAFFDNQHWGRSDAFDLEPDHEVSDVELELNVLSGATLTIQVWHQGEVADDTEITWDVLMTS